MMDVLVWFENNPDIRKLFLLFWVVVAQVAGAAIVAGVLVAAEDGGMFMFVLLQVRNEIVDGFRGPLLGQGS